MPEQIELQEENNRVLCKNIKISIITKDGLDSVKIHPRETYDQVIARGIIKLTKKKKI